MTLMINLGEKRERRLMKHLEMEHPSVRENICIRKGNRKQINRIISNVPDFERQAHKMTQIRKLLKGGRKNNG